MYPAIECNKTTYTENVNHAWSFNTMHRENSSIYNKLIQS